MKEAEEATAEEKKNLDAFFQRLSEGGVPDALQDKFLKFINDPTGVNVEDLWATFESRENRLKASEEKVDVSEMPAPAGALNGESNRPKTDTYKDVMDGTTFIPDANNPF